MKYSLTPVFKDLVESVSSEEIIKNEELREKTNSVLNALRKYVGGINEQKESAPCSLNA